MTTYLLTVTYPTTTGSFAKRERDDAAIERLVGRQWVESGVLTRGGTKDVLRDLTFEFPTLASRTKAIAAVKGRKGVTVHRDTVRSNP